MNILCVRVGAFPEQYKRVLHIVCLNGGNQSEIKPFLLSETTDLPDKNSDETNQQSQQEQNTPLWISVLHSNLIQQGRTYERSFRSIFSAGSHIVTANVCLLFHWPATSRESFVSTC